MKQIEIKANIADTGVALPHLWSKCVGAGRACEGLRADWQAQLRTAVEECGFEYIRFHGLLTDDMGVVHKREDGSLIYHFAYIDSLFDALLDIGIRPFVELGFMPEALASGTTTQFWWKGNVTPPTDLNAWSDFIVALVSHWKERYGIEEIAQWYFEVWNEANLGGFWDGTKAQYFALYKASALAIKSVDPTLRVGGPATSNFVPDDRFAGEVEDLSKHITHLVDDLDSLTWEAVWMQDFINFCTAEDLPVDFISCHPYPTDFALDGHNQISNRTRHKNSLHDDMTWLKKLVGASKYKDAEIHLTEWSSSPSSRDCSHDFLPAANYIVRANLLCAGLANSLSYWVFTDIFEEVCPGPTAFHGGFGMITVEGIKKPSFHAYRMLNQMGDIELARGEDFVVSKAGDDVAALVFNYPEEQKDTPEISVYPDTSVSVATQSLGHDATVSIDLCGLKAHQAVTVELLDTTHGTAVNTWLAMGSPDSLTRDQYSTLKAIADNLQLSTLTADADGVLQATITLPAWGVALIRSK